MTIMVEPVNIFSIDFGALLTAHATFCNALSPEESCHHLPIEELNAENVVVWQATMEGTAVGMGALKELSTKSGEVKSMHTLEICRGMGAASKIMQAMVEEAGARGYESLWLETGSHGDFAPARDLYARIGFIETGPFGDYELDPHSTFMTLSLQEQEIVGND